MTSVPPPLSSSPVLQGERVAFTGTLASMTHRQAQELAVQQGGAAAAHVSRQVTMLVVGEEGWPLEADGGISKKLEAANELAAQGVPLRIVPESDWLQLLGLEERRQEMSRLYTPAMLSQVLNVPVGTIRRWHALGFIRPVKTVWRLPYFDFLEVSAARKVLDLMRSGVSAERLREALERLSTMLGREQFPQARLDLMAQDARLVYRDRVGLVEPASGQRVFDFEVPDEPALVPAVLAFPGPATPKDSATGNATSQPELRHPDPRPHWSAEDWHREGLRLLEAGETDAAIEALRMSLMERPDVPEVHFALAEALYRNGHAAAALERFHAAVEHDHQYVEAWVQLGCLHAEAGRLDQAEDAFRLALNVHADYPDAHWHLADVLQQSGRTREAIPHWRRYLEFDNRGPWADAARQRLGVDPQETDALPE